MLVKLAFTLLIVCLSTVFGTVVAAKQKRKYLFLTALEGFLIYLKREIAFNRTTILQALREYKTDNRDLEILLCSLSSSVREYPEYLTDHEVNALKSFFDKIGTSDKQNELELVSLMLEEVVENKQSEKIVCAKRSALSAKLGFFAGAILLVILI